MNVDFEMLLPRLRKAIVDSIHESLDVDDVLELLSLADGVASITFDFTIVFKEESVQRDSQELVKEGGTLRVVYKDTISCPMLFVD